jgi:ABC-type Mn2+/Zn2+ transport system permease subunit
VLGVAIGLIVLGIVLGFFMGFFGLIISAVGVVLLAIYAVGFARRAKEERV